MYRLYGTVHTGTCAVHAALVEAGADFEKIDVNTGNGDHLSDEYRRINPRQQVPALRLPDGSIITEGPAILMHIADAHPDSRLAPVPGTPERAQHDRWLHFFSANVYEGELRKLFGDRYTQDPDGAEFVQQAATAYVQRHYSIFENALTGQPYVFGVQFTVLDIYIWMLSQWMDGAWLHSHCPKVSALACTVMDRHKIRPVHLANFG